MAKKMRLGIFLVAALFQLSLCTLAQQTLGGITGTVSDSSGSVLPDTTVTIVGDQTKLTRTQKTNGNGAYDFVNLPIGTYTVTVSHDGFQTEKLPSIPVQADRTATLNVTLKVGQVGTTIEVEAAPAMNAVDTTNGYVLEQEQIQAVPLPTGSFTGLAILSPGVNAELPERHRRQRRTGQSADLGQRPARHQQHVPAERRGCQQFVQRQEHQPGGLGARREQHRRCRRGQHDSRNHSKHRVALSGDRPGIADARAGNDSGISRQHLDV